MDANRNIYPFNLFEQFCFKQTLETITFVYIQNNFEKQNQTYNALLASVRFIFGLYFSVCFTLIHDVATNNHWKDCSFGKDIYLNIFSLTNETN